MNVYYNAEYTGAWKDAYPISIGLIAENGKSLYLEFADVPLYAITPFVKENVMCDTYLYDEEYASIADAIEAGKQNGKLRGYQYKITTESTALQALNEWFESLLEERPEETIQLVSYCCHYDACILYNLYRGNIPSYLNKVCYDIIGLVSSYETQKDPNRSLSDKLKVPYTDDDMILLADKLGMPIGNYEKDSSIRYAQIIKNVYEGLQDFSKRYF